MKKSLIVLGIAFLGQTTLASAATDWTPYLQPMLSGCGDVNVPDKLPPHYEASIISQSTVKKETKVALEVEDRVVYTTYTLRNATAFDQPLLKFESQVGYEWNQFHLYFKEDAFTTLRPQFTLPKMVEQNDGNVEVLKNDASGYEVIYGGYLNLIFDKQQKSIVCEAGI
jgi:hypothetical protein